MNKNFNQSPETEVSCNSQSDETPSTEVDGDSESIGAVYNNPRNDSAPKNFHFQTEGRTEAISNGDRATVQAEDYTGNGTGQGNGGVEAIQELFQYRNDQGSVYPSSQEEHDIETILPHNSLSTEARKDQSVFIFPRNAYESEIPRVFPIIRPSKLLYTADIAHTIPFVQVLSHAIQDPVINDEATEDYKQEHEPDYILSSGFDSAPHNRQGTKQKVPKLSWNNDKDDGNGGSGGGGDDRDDSWDPREYGDYWDGYDTSGQDGSGFFGGGGNSGSGGGYPKPGGGYYSLALNSLEEWSWRFKENPQDPKAGPRILCSMTELEEDVANFTI
jgi:hypothetical protein